MLRDATTGDWIGTFAGHKGAVWSCRLDPAALLAGTASGAFVMGHNFCVVINDRCVFFIFTSVSAIGGDDHFDFGLLAILEAEWEYYS